MGTLNNFRKAYFELTTTGGWRLISFNDNSVTLKSNKEVFDIPKTEWMKEQESVLVLTKQCRYSHSGVLSEFDSKVLQSCDFIHL